MDVSTKKLKKAGEEMKRSPTQVSGEMQSIRCYNFVLECSKSIAF